MKVKELIFDRRGKRMKESGVAPRDRLVNRNHRLIISHLSHSVRGSVWKRNHCVKKGHRLTSSWPRSALKNVKKKEHFFVPSFLLTQRVLLSHNSRKAAKPLIASFWQNAETFDGLSTWANVRGKQMLTGEHAHTHAGTITCATVTTRAWPCEIKEAPPGHEPLCANDQHYLLLLFKWQSVLEPVALLPLNTAKWQLVPNRGIAVFWIPLSK